MEKLRELATIDSLTGLVNRRHMLEKINQEVERCRRYGGGFCIAIADIDNFKAVNDTYGHVCGDAVIKHIAALIRNNLRSSDIVSRWGGEEYLLLFPETGIENVKSACDKVRTILEKSSVQYDNHVISVTVTFGIAASTADFDITSMIKKADEALYRGKKSDKNIVTAAGCE